MRCFSKFFLIVLVFHSFLFAQHPAWRIANGTAGIHIGDIDIFHNNADTLYAIGDQFLLSTDNGENWSRIPLSPTSGSGALKVDPFNSKIIYVSHSSPTEGNAVSMTTDGGLNWQFLFLGNSFPSAVMEIDPQDLQSVYVGIGPLQIKRSSDYGQSWVDVTPPQAYWGPLSLAIAPSNGNTLYAGYLVSFYKSTDRGNSWTTLSLGFQFSNGISLAVHPENSDVVYAAVFGYGVYKSTDGGANWNEMNNGLSSDDRDINTIAINPERPKELFIGTGSVQNDLLFKSTDGANNWFLFNNGLPDSGHVSTIAIDTLNDKIFIGVNAFNAAGIYVYESIASLSPHPLTKSNFFLFQNYPNPFNSETMFQFALPQTEQARLVVYNMVGQIVKTLLDKQFPPGKYKIAWDGRDDAGNSVSSGVYFYRVETAAFQQTRKMLLIH